MAIPEKVLVAWPDCKIPGCLNKCCLALKSVYCWPHTKAGKSPEEMVKELSEELVDA